MSRTPTERARRIVAGMDELAVNEELAELEDAGLGDGPIAVALRERARELSEVGMRRQEELAARRERMHDGEVPSRPVPF